MTFKIIRTVYKGVDMKVSERSLWMEFDAIEDAKSFLTANRSWSKGYKTRLGDMFVFTVKNIQTSIKFQIVKNNGSRKHQSHR